LKTGVKQYPMLLQLSTDNLHDLIPLVREYQAFYRVKNINDDKNRQHFFRFTRDTTRGIVYIAYQNKVPIGFCTIYFSFSSAKAEEIGILNDLYVNPRYRSAGIGKLLINRAIDEVSSRGLQRMQWLTADNNVSAKRLYDQYNAAKSNWTLYVLDSLRAFSSENPT